MWEKIPKAVKALIAALITFIVSTVPAYYFIWENVGSSGDGLSSMEMTLILAILPTLAAAIIGFFSKSSFWGLLLKSVLLGPIAYVLLFVITLLYVIIHDIKEGPMGWLELVALIILLGAPGCIFGEKAGKDLIIFFIEW